MITEFRIGCAHTINLGHYESLRVEASVTINVPEVQGSPNEVRANLDDLQKNAQAELRKLLEDTFKEQHRKGKEK